MALRKYLWTSTTLGASATVADHIGKYCWNKPGNWLLLGTTTGIWQPTNTYPGSNTADTYDVYVGCENHSLYGSQIAGWTAAKHPLLFGGCSHADGITWSTKPDWGLTGTIRADVLSFNHVVGVKNISGGTASILRWPYITIGATYIQLEVVTDYPFPYLGGGITGEIAQWCAARDGLTVGSYITANYEGRFDPTKNLKLALSKKLDIIDHRIAGLKGLTATQNLFLANIDLVEKYVSGISGASANPLGAIGLEVIIHNPNGSGVVINGGTINKLYVNRRLITGNHLPPTSGVESANAVKYRSFPYSAVVDAGIRLNNVNCDISDISNVSAVKFYRGNYNTIYLSDAAPRLAWLSTQIDFNPGVYRKPYAMSYPPGSTGLIPVQEFVGGGAPIVCANNWDYSEVLWRTRGFTASVLETKSPDAEKFGTLYTQAIPGPSPSFIDSHQKYGETNYWLSYNTVAYEGNLNTTPHPISSRKSLPPFPDGYRAIDLLNEYHPIILGDPDDQSFSFGTIPGGYGSNLYKVQILNGLTSEAVPAQYVPWKLKFASPGTIQNLEMFIGFVDCTDELLPSSTVRVYEAKLSQHSEINIPEGKDVRFGGFDYGAGGGVGRWWGGIMAMDYSDNRIKGKGQAFWNFANPDGGYRSTRQPAAGEIIFSENLINASNGV